MADALDADHVSMRARGTVLAFHNVASHQLAADLLAREGLFGSAVAHEVLGAEEAIKAVAWFLEAAGVNVGARESKAVFYNHKLRHFLARLEAILSVEAAGELEDLEIDTVGELSTFEEALPIAWAVAQQLMQALGPMGEALVEHGEGVGGAEWWKAADEAKQRGLYVDLVHGGWVTPDDVDRETWLEARTNARGLTDRLSEVLPGMAAWAERDPQSFIDWIERFARPLYVKGLDLWPE